MATFIVGTIVLGLFVFVGYKQYKNKKNGGGCSGNCSGCCKSNNCH